MDVEGREGTWCIVKVSAHSSVLARVATVGCPGTGGTSALAPVSCERGVRSGRPAGPVPSNVARRGEARGPKRALSHAWVPTENT